LYSTPEVIKVFVAKLDALAVDHSPFILIQLTTRCEGVMSKFVKEAQPKVVKHRHCVVCHTPVLEMDKDYCSQKCQDQFKKAERSRKYTTLIMVLVFPTILLIMLLLTPR